MPSDSENLPRWRPRFSLATLLLLSLFVSALALLYLVKRDNDALRRENVKLSTELGRLYIVEKEKIHVLAPKAAMSNTWTWHWRIYIPEGRRYEIRAVVKDVPLHEIPTTKYAMPVSGEFYLDARLQRGTEGRWEFAFYRDADVGYNIPFDHAPDFLTSSSFGAQTELTGVDNVVLELPPKPVVLLRVRQSPANATTADPSPCTGVMLWLEEVKPKQ